MTTRTMLGHHIEAERLRLRLGWGAVAAALAALALAGCAAPAQEQDTAVLAGASNEAEAQQRGDDPQIDPGPTGGETPVAGRPWDPDVSDSCAEAVGAGFTQVAQSADVGGVTSFWARGKDWAVCDVAEGAVDPVVLPAAPGARRGFDEKALAVSTTPVTSDGARPEAVRIVAGGLLPWRVDELSYRFPDGHGEVARFVVGGDDPERAWWVVSYTPTEGPLVGTGAAKDDLGPVTISVVGAAAEAFRLPWEDLQRSE